MARCAQVLSDDEGFDVLATAPADRGGAARRLGKPRRHRLHAREILGWYSRCS